MDNKNLNPITVDLDFAKMFGPADMGVFLITGTKLGFIGIEDVKRMDSEQVSTIGYQILNVGDGVILTTSTPLELNQTQAMLLVANAKAFLRNAPEALAVPFIGKKLIGTHVQYVDNSGKITHLTDVTGVALLTDHSDIVVTTTNNKLVIASRKSFMDYLQSDEVTTLSGTWTNLDGYNVDGVIRGNAGYVNVVISDGKYRQYMPVKYDGNPLMNNAGTKSMTAPVMAALTDDGYANNYVGWMDGNVDTGEITTSDLKDVCPNIALESFTAHHRQFKTTAPAGAIHAK